LQKQGISEIFTPTKLKAFLNSAIHSSNEKMMLLPNGQKRDELLLK
jgi:hypothetical protein